MDYQLEAVHELMFAMWASRSKATRSFERGAQGEMFVLRELVPRRAYAVAARPGDGRDEWAHLVDSGQSHEEGLDCAHG